MASSLFSTLIKSTSIFRSSSLRSSLVGSSTSIFRSPNFSSCIPRHVSLSTAAGPWLMLPPTFENGDGDTAYNFYSLPDNKVVSFNSKRSGAPPTSLNPQHRTEIVGSSHGWLALFNHRNCDLFLWNPITGRHVKLPPIHSLPISQVKLDRGYGCVRKVIISCDDPESEECRAMLMFNTTVERLAFCCPSLSTEWTPVGALKNRPPYDSDLRTYEDVVFSNKLFFCLADYDVDDLEGWDVGDLRSPKLHWSNQNDLLGDDNYFSWWEQADKLLAERTGFVFRPLPLRHLVAAPDDQLFLVTRHLVEQMAPDGSCVDDTDSDIVYPHKTIAFDVHKIDPDEDGGRGKLTHLEGLDGLAIFVGLNHSFAVSASDHQLKPNSIYFTDGLPWPSQCLLGERYGGHDIGIFDYENRTIAPCYYPCEVQSFKLIDPAPIWFTPTH